MKPEEISEHFIELVKVGEHVLTTRFRPQTRVGGGDDVNVQLATQWATRTKHFLATNFGENGEHYKSFVAELLRNGSLNYYEPVSTALATLKAAQEDYNNGHIPVIELLFQDPYNTKET